MTTESPLETFGKALLARHPEINSGEMGLGDLEFLGRVEWINEDKERVREIVVEANAERKHYEFFIHPHERLSRDDVRVIVNTKGFPEDVMGRRDGSTVRYFFNGGDFSYRLVFVNVE